MQLVRRQFLKFIASIPFGASTDISALPLLGDRQTCLPSIESPDTVISVEESDSSIGFYETAGSELARIEVGFWPHEIVVTADRRLAFVTNFGLKDYDERIGSAGSSISVVDLQSACEIRRIHTLGRSRYFAPHGIAINEKAGKLFVNTEKAESGEAKSVLLTFSLNDFDSFDARELPAGVHNLLVAPDDRTLWVYPTPAGASRLDPETGEILTTLQSSSAVRGMTYSADGQAIIASARNEILIAHPLTGKIENHIGNLGVTQILYSAPTPDGELLIAPAVWESQVLFISLRKGKVVARVLTGVDPIHVSVAADARTAYVSHGRTRGIAVLDVSRRKLSHYIETKGGPNGLAVVQTRPRLRRSKLTFGACVPLSGPNSNEGRELRMGYQFWQESVNSKGGIVVGKEPHEVHLIFRDTESAVDSNVVEALCKELIFDEKVHLLLGSYPSPANLHCARVGEQYRIPLVTASGAAEVIYQQGFKYVFGIMSSAKAFLEGTVRAISAFDPKPETAAFISCEDPAALQDAVTTAGIVSKLGMRIVAPRLSGTRVEPPGILVFKHQTFEFRDALSELRGTDLLLHTGHLPESVGLVRSAKAVNFSPQGFAFSVGPAFPAFAQQLGNDARFLFGASMWTELQPDWGLDRYVRPGQYAKQFYARFTAKPSYLAAGATACGIVYEHAIAKAQSVDTQKVRDALGVLRLDTFYSHIEFDDRGLNSKRPIMSIQLQLIDGELVHVPVWPPNAVGKLGPIWPFPGWQ